ncbi:hypothetical protein [Geobacter sp.]|uniref:hypothetical protein n=1 Tax=Geobacter sp. TaxID=46610 RepID=UPI00260A8245|nr:hypothetical protein [Geobacter sp.]
MMLTALLAVMGVASFIYRQGMGSIVGKPASYGTFSSAGRADDPGTPGVSAAMDSPRLLSHHRPILIISSPSNPFTRYYAEILRAEGLNAFDETDISSVTAATLAPYDVVILGDMPLTTSQCSVIGTWVNKGGHLISMRPDKKLAGLLGLTDLSSTLSDAYLLVDTSSAPGSGIVGETMQFHGTADLYSLRGATSIASLCSDARTKTSHPAVTLKSVGKKGGMAAAFAYDLARSVILTRQGNPALAGRERDGYPPIRANDMFTGAANSSSTPDWIDPDKIAIPQADEQQRLLANLTIRMNSDKRPLPRFWYFPRGLKAVVVMTGDDHGSGGTAGRFDAYQAMSPPGCSVEDWECIRSTSYLFPNTPLPSVQAAAYSNAGFEVAPHLDTNCADWTPASLKFRFSDQFDAWSEKYSSSPRPVTLRVHCIAWSDYSTMPKVELSHGVRLDTSYYYWPARWVRNRAGLFTGSGIPMRFADEKGNLIDVYQAVTQMTDESGQAYPFTIDALLDRAIGPEGYYGAFVANMHTDKVASDGSTAIVRSAMARRVPVISARQLLDWLDGRNSSSFNSVTWGGNTLSLSITAAKGAHGLVTMVPVGRGHTVTGVTSGGRTMHFTITEVKGVKYALFPTKTGKYEVRYASQSSHLLRSTPPVRPASSV